MTPEEKRIIIAKACGWDKIYKGPESDNRWMSPDGKYCTDKDIPNYPSDLNVMHEAEKHLTDEQFERYRAILGRMWHENKLTERGPMCATASERADAFIQVFYEHT